MGKKKWKVSVIFKGSTAVFCLDADVVLVDSFGGLHALPVSFGFVSESTEPRAVAPVVPARCSGSLLFSINVLLYYSINKSSSVLIRFGFGGNSC